MKFVSNLFFTDIDFCKPEFIQGLDVNFSLYLLILLRGAQQSNNILMLSKYNIVNCQHLVHQLSTNSPSQQKKQNKMFAIKFGPVCFINI